MGILNDHLNPRLSGCRLAYKLGGRDPQSSAVSAEALGRLHRNLSNSPTAIFVTQAHPGSLNCSAVFVDVAQLRVTTSKHWILHLATVRGPLSVRVCKTNTSIAGADFTWDEMKKTESVDIVICTSRMTATQNAPHGGSQPVQLYESRARGLRWASLGRAGVWFFCFFSVLPWSVWVGWQNSHSNQNSIQTMTGRWNWFCSENTFCVGVALRALASAAFN